MLKTIRNNIQTPYSLHDMCVIDFEVKGDKIVMRTQSGMVRTTPPLAQPNGHVEFHNVQWDFSYAYLLDFTGNVGSFSGEKLFLKEFIEKIKEAGFKVKEIGEIGHEPEAEHIFSMYLSGKWYKLTAKPEIIPDSITESIDVSILQERVLKPILGIEDPRADKRIDFVGGIKGLKELERRCKLDAKLAFSAYPVHISKLIEVADAGLRMPPKSTWFEPKLGSGLFMHEID